MFKIKVYIFLAILCGLSNSTYAQKTTVRATIEPSNIQIGEQAVINLEVIAPKGRDIRFPVYADTLVAGVEVLGMVEPDTVMTEVMTISQKYLITSFDSTLYYIPFLPIADGNDTLYSNGLGLKVSSPQLSDSSLLYLEVLKNFAVDSIDYNRLDTKDIKDIQEVRWTIFDAIYDFIVDFAPYVLGVLILILLGGAALFFFNRKKKKGYYFKPKIELPAHIIALTDLKKLQNSKIWQKGMTKEYYTLLTNIIREYIQRRYGVNATEMTSDEIIETMHRATDTMSATVNLTQILKLADLVKFAKYIPLSDEDDLSLVNAFFFVNQTKIEEIVTDEKNSKNAAKSKNVADSTTNDKANS